MSIETNKQIVREWLSALSEARYDEAWALMDSDGEYWVLRGRKTMGVSDFAGLYSGHIERTFTDGLRFDPVVLTAEDDRVSARVESLATLVSDGSTYDNNYHFLFAVSGGLIRSVWEYGDTYQSWKAFSPPGAE